MATFEVKVYKLYIEEHPNADVLEIARIGDYKSCVVKGQFKTGDLGVYIPEASVVPTHLIEEMGLTGKLAGKDQNRVKAVKLRGVTSQGLVYPLLKTTQKRSEWVLKSIKDPIFQIVNEGDDVTELLGITKYEPPIPIHLSGEVWNAFGYTPSYDIDNIKKFPDIFKDGEEVMFTEKVHGTWCCLGYHPEIDHPIITSKGLSSQGLAFKLNEQNENNVYVRTFQRLTLRDVNNNPLFKSGILGTTLLDKLADLYGRSIPLYILGEVYGPGVQDLAYSETPNPQFRLFDIYIGPPGQGRYVDAESLPSICESLRVDYVPALYRGPFSKQVVDQYTSGKETVSGKQLHIREGIVIKPVRERYDTMLGRVILKSVSDDYLLRKNGTEYN